MKNFLSLILALALTLSQIPPHAFADEFTFDFSADAPAGDAFFPEEPVPAPTVEGDVIFDFGEIPASPEEDLPALEPFAQEEGETVFDFSAPSEEKREEAAEESGDKAEMFSALTEPVSGTCGENLTWTIVPGGELTISGTGKMDNWTLTEDTPWGKTGTTIWYITIENGVTGIGNCAFAYCTALQSVIIPDSVTSIGSYAFASCKNLESMEIPEYVTEIGDYAFSWCESLTSISIPDSVTQLGEGAFSNCNDLKSIRLSDNLTDIADSAFYYCTSLTDIEIPSGVESIGKAVFHNCSKLKSVMIPETVTSIGDGAFAFCSLLPDIKIPTGVMDIGAEVFWMCEDLASITLPKSLRSIGKNSFRYCNRLRVVEYAGTQEDWEKIEIDESGNECLVKALSNVLISAIFPDEAFLEKLRELYPAGLTAEEAAGVTALYIGGDKNRPGSIASLQGIEYFTGLKVLNCSYNALESLDTDSLSSLEWLDCSGNSQLYPNQMLDLTNLKALESLFCNETGIAALSVKGITSLKTLECRSNPNMSALALNRTSLEWLDCSGSKLTRLDLNGCDSLQELICRDNDLLKTLNVSGCRSLNKLYCTGNSLTALDVRGLSALLELDCSNNCLTSLELGGNCELDSLNCSNNKLTALELDDCISLRSLEVHDNCLTYLNVAGFPDCHISGEAGPQSAVLPAAEKNGHVEIFLSDVIPSRYFRCVSVENEGFSYDAHTGIITAPAGTESVAYIFDTGLDDVCMCVTAELWKTDKPQLWNDRFVFGRDQWRFINQAPDFGSNGKYYFTAEDYGRLLNSSGFVEREFINSHKDDKFGGSCYGMAVTAVLINNGYISLDSIPYGPVSNLHEVRKSPCDAVESFINYYHYQQFTWNSKNEQFIFRNTFDSIKLETIDRLAGEAEEGDGVFLLAFDGASGQHAVVGYGLEEGEFPVNGNRYDRKVKIYDCNYPDDPDATALYYRAGTDEWFLYNYKNEYSDINKLQLAAKDPEIIAPHLYSPGVNTVRAMTFSSLQDSCTLKINGVSYYISSDRDYPEAGIYVDIPCGVLPGGETVDNGYTVILPENMTECTVQPVGDENFSLYYPDFAACVSCGAASVNIRADGACSLKNISGDYDVSLIFNEGYTHTPWYQTEISGTGASEISFVNTAEGILVSGDDLSGVSAEMTGTSSTASLSFTCEESSVLLTTEKINGREVAAAKAEGNIAGVYNRLIAVESGFIPQISISQNYLILAPGEKQTLEVKTVPEIPDKKIIWTAVNADENSIGEVIRISGNGEVTAVSEGTAYAIAAWEGNEGAGTARCRIDVTAGSVKVKDVQLPVNKATVELYKTDYATLDVILVLDRNLSSTQADMSGLYVGPVAQEADAGVRLVSAQFVSPAKGSDNIGEYFNLRVKDDRTLEIVPTDEGIKAGLSGSKDLKSSYKARISVTLSDNSKPFTTPEVTLTVKKTLPNVKGSPVKLNSFISGDTQPLVITGAVVTNAAEDESKATPKIPAIPSDMRLITQPDGSYALQLTGAAKSGKANLLLTLGGWRVKKQIAVPVTVAKTEPKLTFKPASLTLLPEGDAQSAVLTVTPEIFRDEVRFPIIPVKVTESSGKTLKEYTVGAPDCVLDVSVSGNTVTAASNANTPRDGKAHTYKLMLRISEPGGKYKEYPLTVKTLASTSKVTMTLKASGSIDTALPGSCVTVTPTLKNFSGVPVISSVKVMTAKTKTAAEQDVTNLFTIRSDGKSITVMPKSGVSLTSGTTYNFVAAAEAGGQRAEASVKLPVKFSKKAPSASVTLKVSGSIDVLKPDTTSVTLTPTVKNLYGYTLRAADLTFKVLNGKTKTVLDQNSASFPFNVAVSGSTFIVTAKPGVPNHAEKYYVSLAVPGIARATADAALSVKMSAAKITAAPAAGTMYMNDRYSSVIVNLVPADPTLPGVKSVTGTGAGFTVRDLGSGQIMISFAKNQIPAGFKAGQSKTVKLNVFLEGNNSVKANAAVSVKIAIK